MGLHFSVEEFKNRKDKVIKLLKEEKLDAILMFRQESMYWLTGYDTFGYVFFQTLVLDKKGNMSDDEIYNLLQNSFQLSINKMFPSLL